MLWNVHLQPFFRSHGLAIITYVVNPTWLDYCNGLNMVLSLKTVQKFHLLQDAVARWLVRLNYREHISAAFKRLAMASGHNSACLQAITYKALNGVEQGYLKVCPLSYDPTHQLKKMSQALLCVLSYSDIKCVSIGNMAFSVGTPTLWNSLSTKIHLAHYPSGA